MTVMIIVYLNTLVVFEKADFTVANDVLSFSNEFCVT